MNKKKKIVFIIYMVIGLMFIAGGWALNNDYYSSMVFATGVGFFTSAAINFYREYRNTRPENKAEYEARMKEQSINLKDERKVFLRYKASYRTMQLSVMICFFGAGILAWFKANPVVITVLFVIAVVQYLTASVVYKYFCRKM